ncbi:MAG: hypothetical protein LR015_05940 [Verrucomicrobia bacterium]|nr:hypothetical protein [Verrucomicrobiota bacterium]
MLPQHWKLFAPRAGQSQRLDAPRRYLSQLPAADLALQSYRSIAEDSELSVDRAFRIARRLASSAAWNEVEAFLDLVEANPSADFSPAEQIEILNLRAQSDLALNKASSAAERLARVVELDPLNGKALLLLGNYHWTQGNAERAESS